MNKQISLSEKPLVVITGPTATGKSKIGIMVASRINGEIVSADSMLLYRHMNIGTAKPTIEERQGIPHHMIDVAEPDQEYSAALYQTEARQVIDGILERKHLPILVGGTGLYIRAVIDPFTFGTVGGNPVLRKRLMLEAEQEGADKLYKRLSEIDAIAANKLHPKDIRRIIRALEVYYLTGKPFSSFIASKQSKQPVYRLYMFGLNMDRSKLYRRIEQRVDNMIAAGFVSEVQQILARGYSRNLNSMRSLGYREIASYLYGEITLEEAIALIKRNTRRFAKRQLSWFRRDKRIKWLDLDSFDNEEAVVQEITNSLEGVF